MPAIAWTYPQDVRPPAANIDRYFQRLLHMRVQPMAPVFGADHAVEEGEAAQAYYDAYGPLFKRLRGPRLM